MKADIKNKILLEEEVYDLRSRLTKHKELEKKVADLQVCFFYINKICFFNLMLF